MVESFLNWLLKRSLRQESIATSSTRTTAGDAPETSVPADQVRRQRDRLLTQWSLESGLPQAEFCIVMHDLAANLPHYVGGGHSENLP